MSTPKSPPKPEAFYIESSAGGIKVETSHKKPAGVQLKHHKSAAHFFDGYANYCKQMGFQTDVSTIKSLAEQAPTGLDVVPWWTSMTAQVVGAVGADPKKQKGVLVSLNQHNDVYLCYAFRDYEPINGKKEKRLLAPPVLDFVSRRMLHGLTVQNYMRFLLSGQDDLGIVKDPTVEWITNYLATHSLDLALKITKTAGTHRTSIALQPKPRKPGSDPSGIYAHHKQLFCLPDPRKPTEFKRVLVTSSNVRAVLPGIGKVWSGPKPCKTLILAPSGAGKEVLKDFICSGLKPRIDKKGRIEEISLVGLDPQGCYRVLFGESAKGDGFRYGALPRAQRLTTSKSPPQPGIVFIDEIHQADPATRASLLRVLEAGEYFAPGIKEPINCKNLHFVFAASCTVDSLRTLDPPDFWNRMDFFVEMEHPFAVEESIRPAVVGDYLDMFLVDSLSDLVRQQRESGGPGKDIGNLLDEGLKAASEEIDKASSELAKHIAYLRPGTISVRHLRSLAQLMANLLVDHVFVRGNFESDKIKEVVGGWVVDRNDDCWRTTVFRRLGEIVASR